MNFMIELFWRVEFMRCKKCNQQNVNHANYCYFCGGVFSEEERKCAREKSVWYKLVQLKDRYDTITLSKITGSKAFQVGSIIGTILIGGYFIIQNGYQFKLKESDSYTYEYNINEKEYYVYLKNDEAQLNLYAPESVNQFYVRYYSEDNELLSENGYDNIEDVKVEVQNNNPRNYYKISYDKSENDINTIKIYTLKEASNE